MTNSLTYFRVDGSWRDIEQPIPGNTGSIAPQENDVSAYVDFFPGLQKSAVETGLTFLAPNYETFGDTEVALAPITARAMNGVLCSITKTDPVGAQLVSNAAWMGLGVDLFYHVRYRNVTYGGALQRFSSFAFKAPTDGTGVRITSTTLQRYDYCGP
jgi:hypothetical protein